ncbi:hypothetical protein CAEBREN_15603 [Caenorhabditis brenneri]|uniref:Uncharacterized protein n=1 Tax=Caenorhabditis brenneri TaxID=135651 RepID=G0NZD7_CAEBE|nr:hypothetical protein CAEBREN_15603 [Caenorhabditis brenneri]
MAAVFSAPLATHAPKVVTRHSKPDTQMSKPNYPKTPYKPMSKSTNTPSSGGKWKISVVEALVDSEPNQRAPADGSEPLPKNPRIESSEDDQVRPTLENRKRYLGEKAATVYFPTKEQVEICPKYLFEEPALIIHMCLDCRIASRQLEMTVVDKDNQQLGIIIFLLSFFKKKNIFTVVSLCFICRASVKAQHRAKFFQHDLLSFKRREIREALKDKNEIREADKKDLKQFAF